MTGYRDKDLNINEKYILRIISTILTVAFFNMLTVEGEWNVIEYVNKIDTTGFIISIVCVFVIYTCFDIIFKRAETKNIDAVVFGIIAVVFGFYMLIGGIDIYLTIITVLFVVIAVRYVLMRFPVTLKNFKLTKTQGIMIIVFLAVLTLLYVGSLVVLRYYLFKTPTYDFGIFSQMYYYMKETGMPMTTCERDYYLSHFAIHFSPVFYLILPIYMIFPHPVTLIIMQLIIVMLGAVPVYFICKNRKYSNFISFGLAAVFLLYPTMRTGLFYDFHENKFLPVMLLWLIYFIDNTKMQKKKRIAGIIIFALLSLMIKEDAAIYVACIGLFNLVYKKDSGDKKTGAILFLGAVLYFFIVFYCLGKFGAGNAITSIGRYDNLMVSSEDGLTGMIMNIIKDPAFVIKQLLKKEKLEFIFWTMMPLLFIPLFVKKISMYILLIPYMVMNLLTNYTYQYDIGFQYTYGSCTLLIYMAVLYFEGAENIKKKRCLILMLITTLLCTTNAMSGKNIYYENVEETLESNEEIFDLLETIPEDASVKASTWFVPALSQREEVYDYDYSDEETDFIVFDMRTQSVRNKNNVKIAELTSEGYSIYEEIEDKVVILYKK